VSREGTVQSLLCARYIHIDPGVRLTNSTLQGVITGASLGGVAFLVISSIVVIYVKRKRRLRPDGPAVRDTGRSDTPRITDPLSGPKFGPRHRPQAQMPKGKNVTSFEIRPN
jgi:hypothetical protein